jgi:general secretion pathway protein D
VKDPVVFLPLPFSNDILVFSNRKDVFDRAMTWIDKLDKPAAFGDQEGVFVYEVKNTSAAELGALVARTGATEGPQASTPVRRQALPRGAAAPIQASTGPSSAGKITIDSAGNRLIFRGTPSEFERAQAVMKTLDTPPQQVLVEVTIAEVRLTDETRFGIDWLLNQASSGDTLNVNTRGASVRQPGGLGATLTHGFPRGTVVAALNAFAQNNNVNILSTPRLLARSGSEAQILIGNDVPIITSQRAADQQTGGNTDILQTVQYRQTGVILSVRPTVYGDDRVDIDLYQEVSDKSNDAVTGIASPTITNRSVSTKLSLREGTTAVIGGLIQDNYGRKQTGVPLLKDAPILGQAFRTDDLTGVKSELLILVTPYIMRNDEQLSAATQTYSASIDRMLRKRGGRTYTLLPWRLPLSTPVQHGGADPRVDGQAKGKPAEAGPAPEDSPST